MKTNLTNQEIYSLLSGRLSMTLNRTLLQSFRNNDIPLTREQWSILAVLWKQDGCSQQTLANETYRDKPSITRLLDKMEKDNLVLRKADKDDRRLNLIFLTPKGKSLEEKAFEIVNDIEAAVTKGLSAAQVANLKETIKVILSNIENQ